MTEKERILKEVKRSVKSALGILEDESSEPEPQTIRNLATTLQQAGADLFILYGQQIQNNK